MSARGPSLSLSRVDLLERRRVLPPAHPPRTIDGADHAACVAISSSMRHALASSDRIDSVPMSTLGRVARDRWDRDRRGRGGGKRVHQAARIFVRHNVDRVWSRVFSSKGVDGWWRANVGQHRRGLDRSRRAFCLLAPKELLRCLGVLLLSLAEFGSRRASPRHRLARLGPAKKAKACPSRCRWSLGHVRHGRYGLVISRRRPGRRWRPASRIAEHPRSCTDVLLFL